MKRKDVEELNCISGFGGVARLRDFVCLSSDVRFKFNVDKFHVALLFHSEFGLSDKKIARFLS